MPSVGNFRQGMLVCVPLHLDTLPGKPEAADLEATRWRSAMPARPMSSVRAGAAGDGGKLEPEALNDTDQLELRVFGNDSAARRCWSPGSTISARAPRARPSRTSG